MKIFVAGISYKTAPVELREQLAVTPSRLRCAGCRLKIGGALTETVVLSTCNRVEIYGVSEKVNGNIAPLFRHLAARELDVVPYLYVREGADAIRHLFSVSSGMDSMVLGETEITGQVKNAYQTAHEAKLTGRVMNRLFQKALQTAKEIRSRTSIGRGATSVGSVAVELAEKIFDRNLSERTVMIIGAGKMGEACVRHLAKKGARSVLVSNRSFERAQTLAAEFGGRAIPLDEKLQALAEADIVVSSTGCPQTILNREDVEKVMPLRRNRPLVLIDIAVPRDIDPDVQLIPNVYLYNIDDLDAIVRENVKHREKEFVHCRAIIEKETAAVMSKLLPVSPRGVVGTGRGSGAGCFTPRGEKEFYEPCIQPDPHWVFYGAAACRS
ncbi:MAG: glutamyl-tRNA reductase [Verrucomicrobia bacterium]|nr:glutamyl-tRNA reductase [Verrucomicrobiota bacterium]